jgi:hypothetical protein
MGNHQDTEQSKQDAQKLLSDVGQYGHYPIFYTSTQVADLIHAYTGFQLSILCLPRKDGEVTLCFYNRIGFLQFYMRRHCVIPEGYAPLSFPVIEAQVPLGKQVADHCVRILLAFEKLPSFIQLSGGEIPKRISRWKRWRPEKSLSCTYEDFVPHFKRMEFQAYPTACVSIPRLPVEVSPHSVLLAHAIRQYTPYFRMGETYRIISVRRTEESLYVAICIYSQEDENWIIETELRTNRNKIIVQYSALSLDWRQPLSPVESKEGVCVAGAVLCAHYLVPRLFWFDESFQDFELSLEQNEGTMSGTIAPILPKQSGTIVYRRGKLQPPSPVCPEKDTSAPVEEADYGSPPREPVLQCLLSLQNFPLFLKNRICLGKHERSDGLTRILFFETASGYSSIGARSVLELLASQTECHVIHQDREYLAKHFGEVAVPLPDLTGVPHISWKIGVVPEYYETVVQQCAETLNSNPMRQQELRCQFPLFFSEGVFEHKESVNGRIYQFVEERVPQDLFLTNEEIDTLLERWEREELLPDTSSCCDIGLWTTLMYLWQYSLLTTKTRIRAFHRGDGSLLVTVLREGLNSNFPLGNDKPRYYCVLEVMHKKGECQILFQDASIVKVAENRALKAKKATAAFLYAYGAILQEMFVDCFSITIVDIEGQVLDTDLGYKIYRRCFLNTWGNSPSCLYHAISEPD